MRFLKSLDPYFSFFVKLFTFTACVMMNFVPILPLRSIIFPFERVNMRLSGKSAIQVVRDCIDGSKSFGIVYPTDGGHFQQMGTLAEVVELVRVFKNGNIHVRIRGTKVFRILEIKKNIPEKPYQGAIVEYPSQKEITVHPKTEALIVSEVKRLYRLLHLEKKFPEKSGNWLSFDFAHKIGLSPGQEYELITILSEIQRMEYIRRHLNAMMPVVEELEEMKRRIKMNGHFRDLS